MSGVYLVYELATPTTESAAPYTNPQIVDDFGTEEYVTDSIVPVGHVTKYMDNHKSFYNKTIMNQLLSVPIAFFLTEKL